MVHLPTIVSDLALILITAGAVTILFKWLKQPVVLGYIVAGFLISPHFLLLPSVADPTNISSWAEIGVIFLLFALGLEFSFKKLINVGGTAAIATLINMGSMIAIGYIVGQLLGWTHMECLFLGNMLSMSSTTIIIKAFNDMGLQKHKFAEVVFGMLIIEDLAAILMMVLLSTLAVSQNFEGTMLVESGLKLLFFIVIWFVIGIYLIPTTLRKLQRFLNDETLLIISVGMCLGMVLFADAVGFSAALGAFIMGSILAETIESKRIEHLVGPLKNLFGAVFFVSVGMMINPDVILQYAGPILLLTGVVLVGRTLFATLGVIASGQGLKVATQAGFSLAQIGEFSFIIATLGMQLGVIGEFLYPIIVAVSVITTFTTPYCIKASGPIAEMIERRIPKKWNKLITGYASPDKKDASIDSGWRKHLRSVAISVSIYFALALAIALLSRKYLAPFINENISGLLGSVLTAFITVLVMSPFLSAIIRGRRHNHEEERKLWQDNNLNKVALIALSLIRWSICILLVTIVLGPLFPSATGLIIGLSIIVALIAALVQGFREPTKRLEKRFLHNFNEKERLAAKQRPVTQQVHDTLLKKNIHISEFDVPPHSRVVGMSVKELDLRKKVGTNIICIIRGQSKINIPGPKQRIYPYDKIYVAGTDEQLQALLSMIEESHDEHQTQRESKQYEIKLSHYTVGKDSPLAGKSIKESRIQDRTGCIITGIERKGKMISNFSADFVLKNDDILWLAGGSDGLAAFAENIVKDAVCNATTDTQKA